MDGIAQLFIIGVSGLSLTDEEKNFIRDEKVGGVILFSHNYESPAQLAELANQIQTLRDEYPLFISVDQEGGRVIRFKEPFTQFPSMAEVGMTKSPKICFEIHRIMATELLACGVNVNFSPVCDVLTNSQNKVIGDRSFGKDKELVSKFISAAIRGLQTNGILGCAKHFPGHGGTSKDTHLDKVILKTSLEDLSKNELIPFVKAAKARVEFLMMSHIIVDCIDEVNPVSLSSKAYDIVRDELKFKNIIVTDDLEMAAIMENVDPEEIPIRAFAAGADMLIYRSFESGKKAIEATKKAMKFQKLKNNEMKEKLERVLKIKKKHFVGYRPIYIPSIRNQVNTGSTKVFLNDLEKKIAQLSS